MAKKRKRTRAASKREKDEEEVKKPVVDDPKGGSRSGGQDESNENDSQHFKIPFNDKQITCERRGQGDKPSLIFTHGAGGGISTPACADFAYGFGEVASIVSYQGTMNLQSRVKAFNAVVEHEDFDIALGGRSMGARAATMTAAQEGRKTKALVLVSYPLVGGKNNDVREQILLDLPENIDVLFISGTKDAQCDLAMLKKVSEKMKAKSWFVAVKDADHGMSWKHKASVQTMRRKTGQVAAQWLAARDPTARRYELAWSDEEDDMWFSEWQDSVDAIVDDLEPERPAKKRKRRGRE